ncbi:GTP pyrophosphokinase family protein [Acidobacteriota bacterium]
MQDALRGNTLNLLLEEYKKRKPFYEKFTKKIKRLLTDILENEDIKIHSISSRTKEIESLAGKISKKPEKYIKINDINDLSGIRIICYFLSHVDKIARIIEKNFQIIENLSIDRRKIMDPERFGYISLHYVIKLSHERTKLPEYEKFKNLLCELQIRSILQHTWAEIEHDLGYKSKIEVPKNVRRRFSRLASILELADEEFENIKNQIHEYSSEVFAKLKSEEKRVAVDRNSIEAYIKDSILVNEFDKKIATMKGWIISKEYNVGLAALIINSIGISSLKELDRELDANAHKFMEFVKKYLGEYGEKGKVELPGGISLYYFAYFFLGLSKNPKKIKDYFDRTNLVIQKNRGSTANHIVGIMKEIN